MWAGFAVFGWVYLGIAFGIGSEGNGATPPPFPLQALFDYMRDWPMVQTDAQTYGERFLEPLTITGNLGGSGTKPVTLTRIDLLNLRRVVHTLGAVLFALLGALVGRVFAARNAETGGLPSSNE